MKHLVIGLLIFIFGFFVLAICLNIFNDGKNNDIVFSILYLSAIVGGCTSLILDELNKKEK